MQQATVGIVGVGTISTAIVEAVLTLSEHDGVRFVLSPRSEARACALAARFPSVRVTSSNQEVLDACDLVLLAVLPSQVETVCADLRFRPDHVVASLVAGWPPSRLPSLLSPAATVCQLIPLPMIRAHVGPIVMYPEVDAVRALLESCGEIVVPASEAELAVLAAGSATMSSYFALQAEIVGWISSQGLPDDIAERYVAALFHGLSLETAHAGSPTARALITEHETAGGLNEQVRMGLEQSHTFQRVSDELSRLLRERLSGR